MILKATDFKYPSLEERIHAHESYPEIKVFGFTSKDELNSLMTSLNEMANLNRNMHLYYWDMCLHNKFGHLRESYIYLITHFNRGIQEDFSIIDEKYINKALFDFNAEAFYNLFFSSRDIIAQIINIYYEMNKKEGDVCFNRICNEIKGDKIKSLLNGFKRNSEKASEYRNNLTHNFPNNFPDYRPTISHENGHMVYGFGRGDYTKPSEFVDNINNSLVLLSTFLNDLRTEFKLDNESSLN